MFMYKVIIFKPENERSAIFGSQQLILKGSTIILNHIFINLNNATGNSIRLINSTRCRKKWRGKTTPSYRAFKSFTYLLLVIDSAFDTFVFLLFVKRVLNVSYFLDFVTITTVFTVWEFFGLSV